METKDINGYTLVNAEKVNRAIYGAVLSQGQMKGGVGESATDEELLAEYDRLGGLILKGKFQVKLGSFYDFKTRKPRAKPEIVFVFKDLTGETVEVEEGEALPLDVQAAEKIKEKKVAKAKATGKKKAKADDDE